MCKALHRPFASLMGILCAIVEPTADLVPLASNTDLVHRGRIWPKPIGDGGEGDPGEQAKSRADDDHGP
jgi:hypothetical protein